MSVPTATPTVAFTTPPNYAARLAHLLALKGFNPISSPTLIVQPTPSTISALKPYLSPPPFARPLLRHRLPFTHRNHLPFRGRRRHQSPSPVAARRCIHYRRAGQGRRAHGRQLLPVVVGLVEPPVVPDFLRDLEAKRWVPVRVNAYETRWAGPGCAKQVVERIEEGALDAMVFTSTAEVEGLLKSFKEFGLDWEIAKKRCPKMLVAAHGPITAAGAHMLGVRVDLVSSQFDSFQGVVDALHTEISRLS
ncbi:hypothetical protein L3X38_040414 [Prunus dulcis]|uniref:Tetrapyrrole biosynthesis uroporphyrinogen III synthase domain-containing protein n=1 Tax=Prunus dulcis TaxID=3755 RepID=A0AAD4YTE1_PRUDU|nr:hypothetical protein L3X38_040414 [Prunus dulcis]